MANSDGGFNISELIGAIKGAHDNAQAKKESLNGFLEQKLSEDDARRVREVLADKQKTAALLESDAAKALFKKLTGGDHNG